MQPVVLDTDVASLSHRRKVPDQLASRMLGRRPMVTFVTLGELTKWVQVRRWGSRSRQELADWLSPIAVLPGDEAVAVTWGRPSAAAHQRGRPRPVNDMWIAACCLTHDLPLATLNVRDYLDFAEHHGLRLIATELPINALAASGRRAVITGGEPPPSTASSHQAARNSA